MAARLDAKGKQRIVRHDRPRRRRGSVPAASARDCGSAIRRRSRRRRGPRPRRAADRHRTRRCRRARRRTTCQSSADQPSRPGRSSATMPACDATGDRGRRRRRRGCLQHQIVAIDPSSMPAARAALQGLGRAHSRALQPAAVFSGADWGGRFASAPSAAVPPLVFNGLARTVWTGAVRRYRPHRWRPSAGRAPRSHWPDWISAWARTMRTVRTVAPRHFLARSGSVRW